MVEGVLADTAPESDELEDDDKLGENEVVDVEDADEPLVVDWVAVADRLGENDAVDVDEGVEPPVSEGLSEDDRLGE